MLSRVLQQHFDDRLGGRDPNNASGVVSWRDPCNPMPIVRGTPPRGMDPKYFDFSRDFDIIPIDGRPLPQAGSQYQPVRDQLQADYTQDASDGRRATPASSD